MEFLDANLINTTTMIVVGSNTATAKNIMNRDVTFQYYTDGLNNDATQASIRINFDATTAIDRIALVGINLKNFILYYNGVTANTFALTTTAATTASTFTTNSETALFMACTQVNVTSVSLDMRSTIVANSEKAVGYLALSTLELDFDRIPSAKNYNPNIDSTEVIHKMSDGGYRVQRVQEKFTADIKFANISTTFRNQLKTVFDAHVPLLFVPFGTTTAWDQRIHQVVWHGDFNFYKFSDDASDAGFSGTITLRETTL